MESCAKAEMSQLSGDCGGAGWSCPSPTAPQLPLLPAAAGFTVPSCWFSCFWLQFEAFTFLSSPSCCGVVVVITGCELVMLLGMAPWPTALGCTSPGFVF